MAYTRSDVTLGSQQLVDNAVRATLATSGQTKAGGYVSIAIPIFSRSGSAIPASVFAWKLLLRKAVLTHKGTGSNLLLTMANWALWTGPAGGAGEVLFPDQSYTLEPGGGLRFDLHNIYAVDADGATAHDILILGWL